VPLKNHHSRSEKKKRLHPGGDQKMLQGKIIWKGRSLPKGKRRRRSKEGGVSAEG